MPLPVAAVATVAPIVPDPQDAQGRDIYWVNQYAVPPDQPGGTRHFDFAAELDRRGHRVHLVASDLNLTTRRYSRRSSSRDLRAIREDLRGVEFTWLTAGSYRANDWRRIVSMVVFGAAAFIHLLRAPKHSGRTVFIGSSPHLFAALGTWVAATIRRIPFVFEVRDLWPESYAEVAGKDKGLEITLMRGIADLLYKRARTIIVLAEPNADRIAARGIDREKIVHVPNGVDLEGFLEGEPAVNLSTPGAFTFVYAGAHGPANDLATVVRAAALLEAEGRSDIRVALVGDGPAKHELQSLARTLGVSTLRFVDPVPKDAIGPTLATADAGLMVLAPVDLFAYGVSPNKLFDYLAAGLPVLTNVPGLVASIVENSGVGTVVKAGDSRALARAMTAMANDPPDARSRGPEFISSHFERRNLADRIAGLVQHF